MAKGKPILHAIHGKYYEWQCSECHATFSGNKMHVAAVYRWHVRQQHKPTPNPKQDLSPQREPDAAHNGLGG
jgi:NAD-dependent SIR2 family protein deacetylase